ncbi:MAG: hypothetical protein V4481_05025, partial [Patescibacteria group bacterium]
IAPPVSAPTAILPGKVAAMVFCFIVWECTFPFAIKELGTLAMTNWPMIIGAGIVSALGMLCMTGVLSKAEPQKIGQLIVLMIIVQTAVTAIYQTIMDRDISLSRCVGFALAAAAIFLLNKK